MSMARTAAMRFLPEVTSRLPRESYQPPRRARTPIREDPGVRPINGHAQSLAGGIPLVYDFAAQRLRSGCRLRRQRDDQGAIVIQSGWPRAQAAPLRKQQRQEPLQPNHWL